MSTTQNPQACGSSEWVAKHFGVQPHAANRAANAASFGEHQVSARTAERWLNGTAKPSPESLEILAARFEELDRILQHERRKTRDAIRATEPRSHGKSREAI